MVLQGCHLNILGIHQKIGTVDGKNPAITSCHYLQGFKNIQTVVVWDF